MSKKTIFMLFLVVFVLFCSTCTQAGSIWAKRDKNMKSLYADDVARQIGDVLTIKITEDSKDEEVNEENTEEDYSDYSYNDLRSIAKDKGIELGKSPNKETILKALRGE